MFKKVLSLYDFVDFWIHLFILAAVDAYDIGRLAYTDGRYDLTVDWMKEALILSPTNEEQKKNLPNKVDVLDHLAWSEYKVRKTFPLVVLQRICAKDLLLFLVDC